MQGKVSLCYHLAIAALDMICLVTSIVVVFCCCCGNRNRETKAEAHDIVQSILYEVKY